MNMRLGILITACVLLATSCAPSPQNLIVGKWEVVSAPVKMSAEFNSDGTASVTMMGHTFQGTYKMNSDTELEWSMNGTTTKAKVKVTPTELELTDDQNRTVKYRRK